MTIDQPCQSAMTFADLAKIPLEQLNGYVVIHTVGYLTIQWTPEMVAGLAEELRLVIKHRLYSGATPRWFRNALAKIEKFQDGDPSGFDSLRVTNDDSLITVNDPNSELGLIYVTLRFTLEKI